MTRLLRGLAIGVGLVVLVLVVGVLGTAGWLHFHKKVLTPQERGQQQQQALCSLTVIPTTNGKPMTRLLNDSRWNLAIAQADLRWVAPTPTEVPPTERQDVILVHSAIDRLARRHPLTAAQVTTAEAAAGRIDAWVSANCPAAATSTTSKAS